MATTTAITTAALNNVFISASQCPEGNLLKTGPECKRTRAKARDYIWESTFGMAPGCSGSTFGLAPGWSGINIRHGPGWSGSTFGLAPGWSGINIRHGPGWSGINIRHGPGL